MDMTGAKAKAAAIDRGGRPRTGRSEKMTLSLPVGLLRWVEASSGRLGIPPATFVRMALNNAKRRGRLHEVEEV